MRAVVNSSVGSHNNGYVNFLKLFRIMTMVTWAEPPRQSSPKPVHRRSLSTAPPSVQETLSFGREPL
jgi:hypothetical protein